MKRSLVTLSSNGPGSCHSTVVMSFTDSTMMRIGWRTTSSPALATTAQLTLFPFQSACGVILRY